MDTYGPPLPPGFKLPTDENSESEDEQPKKKAKVIGPQIPSFLTQKEEDNFSSSESGDDPQTSQVIGPVLPNTYENNSDVDHQKEIYGPMPPETKVDYDVVGIIEKRATNMKNKLNNKDSPVAENIQREEWMVVPDTSRRNQLGAISRCLAPGSKVQKRETDCHNPEEDKRTTEELKKYNKSKRGKSLLDLHQKEKKKKDRKERKEKKSKYNERKAFDRDEIAIRQFTKDQVNSVIDKAKYLNSRFAPGKSQYL